MHPVVERVMGKTLVLHQFLYERTDGRIGASLGGRPMLLLRGTEAQLLNEKDYMFHPG